MRTAILLDESHRESRDEGIVVFMLGLLPLLPVLPVSADSRFAWPDAHQAAVTLTYDDAIAVSDLDVAVPQLNRAGLRGTFFLMGKAVSAADVPRWRAVAH
jgi:hypothetical protein